MEILTKGAMSATIAESLEFPAVEPALVPVVNALVGTSRTFTVPLGGEECVLRFLPAGIPPRAPWARVSCGGEDVWVCLDTWDAFAGASEVLAGHAIDRLPLDLWPAVLSALFAADLERLAEFLQSPGEITEVCAQLPSDLHAFGLHIQHPHGTIPGQVAAQLSGWQRIHDWATQAGPPAIAQSVDHIVLRGTIEIGMTVMSLAELRQVRRHDVVVMDVAAPVEAPVGLLRLAPQCSWRVTWEGSELTLEEQVHPEQDATGPAAPLTARIVFQRGQTTLPVGQLSELGPGGTLPLTDDGTVTLRSGEHVLGRGELVQIAGCTGVRLDDWYAGDGW